MKDEALDAWRSIGKPKFFPISSDSSRPSLFPISALIWSSVFFEKTIFYLEALIHCLDQLQNFSSVLFIAVHVDISVLPNKIMSSAKNKWEKAMEPLIG